MIEHLAFICFISIIVLIILGLVAGRKPHPCDDDCYDAINKILTVRKLAEAAEARMHAKERETKGLE